MTSVELNTHIPHSARIYDYMLGGKDNFAADRQSADGDSQGPGDDRNGKARQLSGHV